MVEALLTFPGLRHAFNFGPIGPVDWIVATLAGFASVGWFELYKRRRP